MDLRTFLLQAEASARDVDAAITLIGEPCAQPFQRALMMTAIMDCVQDVWTLYEPEFNMQHVRIARHCVLT